MKRSYFFIVFILMLSVTIKPNIFNDFLAGAKKWWQSLTEEKREKMREGVRKEAVETFNEDYLWNKGTKPQADRAYNYISEKIAEDTKKITSQVKRDAAWTIGTVAVVGAATYGLYQWATRRGLGGITNDFKAIDSKMSGIFNQIDKKYSDLKLKPTLTDADKSLGKGLSILIKSKIDEWQRYVNVLKFKHDQLKKIIEPQKNSQQPKKVSQSTSITRDDV